MLVDGSNTAAREPTNESCTKDATIVAAARNRHCFEQQLEKSWPPDQWRDTHVVLAVSGGADSLAMLRAVVAIKTLAEGAGELRVAHLNHCLRGFEADADEVWLGKVCQQLGVSFETAKVNVAEVAAQQGDGIEAAARSARYGFLQEVAERHGARYVVTAHTADDQVETVLQRILRGSGLAGLAGIPRHRQLADGVSLVRPILTLWRRDVIAYLAELGQDYCTDPSNNEPRHTRNRLRNELLPLLRREFNADVDGALTSLAIQAGESQQLIERIAGPFARRCVTLNKDPTGQSGAIRSMEIDCVVLANESPFIVREVCKAAWQEAMWPLQAMGFKEWSMLATMASGESSRFTANLPANVQVRRDGNLLILSRSDLA